MPLCAQLNADGTLTPTGQTAQECTGYLLLTPAESAWLNTWSVWMTPPSDPAVVAGWFSGPFVLIVGLYLAAHNIGKIPNMFRGR